MKVSEIDKINIVSSQVVLEVSFFRTDARSKSSMPVVYSHVDSRLFRPHQTSISQSPFTHATDFCHTTFYDNPDFVIDKIHMHLGCLDATGSVE